MIRLRKIKSTKGIHLLKICLSFGDWQFQKRKARCCWQVRQTCNIVLRVVYLSDVNALTTCENVFAYAVSFVYSTCHWVGGEGLLLKCKLARSTIRLKRDRQCLLLYPLKLSKGRHNLRSSDSYQHLTKKQMTGRFNVQSWSLSCSRMLGDLDFCEARMLTESSRMLSHANESVVWISRR